MNAEFQRVARREKKDFLSEQCKDGTIKDRNGKDLTEEEIKKRGQEYTELYKKDLNDPDSHDGVSLT